MKVFKYSQSEVDQIIKKLVLSNKIQELSGRQKYRVYGVGRLIFSWHFISRVNLDELYFNLNSPDSKIYHYKNAQLSLSYSLLLGRTQIASRTNFALSMLD